MNAEQRISLWLASVQGCADIGAVDVENLLAAMNGHAADERDEALEAAARAVEDSLTTGLLPTSGVKRVVAHIRAMKGGDR